LIENHRFNLPHRHLAFGWSNWNFDELLL